MGRGFQKNSFSSVQVEVKRSSCTFHAWGHHGRYIHDQYDLSPFIVAQHLMHMVRYGMAWACYCSIDVFQWRKKLHDRFVPAGKCPSSFRGPRRNRRHVIRWNSTTRGPPPTLAILVNERREGGTQALTLGPSTLALFSHFCIRLGIFGRR
jgi:hypothetical protein